MAAWHAEAEAAGELQRAVPGTRFRHSDAGSCARAIAFAAVDAPVTNPMGEPDHYITSLGHLIHDEWQAKLAEAYPGTKVEVKVQIGDDTSGHSDAEVTLEALDDGADQEAKPAKRLVSIEAKSVGGFAYKQAVGERGPAQGPSPRHVVQGALNGFASGADEVVVVYLPKELLSHQAAARMRCSEQLRGVAEWTLTRDQYVPIAEREIHRVEGILDLVDHGTLPRRKIPDPDLPLSAEIIDPANAHWTASDDRGNLTSGTHWACWYCRFQRLCTFTSTGQPGIDEVAVAIERVGEER